ncbi:MAG: hypothetical protein MK082_04705 [Phycisphaerales bacterium]|nr:hypothetical protein [Phycisphaerales bacterium]
MLKNYMVAASAAFIVAGAAFGQEEPDPNPVPNADGTSTYYCGHNMQWTPATAMADCSSGDEIVIMGGLNASPAIYVESVTVNKADVTVRSCVIDDGASAGSAACWGSVILRNPTVGPEANNNSAVSTDSSCQNVNIGRPSLVTQLANGNITTTQVPYGGSNAEFSSTATLTYIAAVDANNQSNYTTAASRTALQDGSDSAGDLAFQIESRSIDKVAIHSDGSAANFSCISITTMNGFGGGIMVTGAGDTSNYSSCSISNTYSGGQDLNGNPVHAIYVGGGSPMFNGCDVNGNMGGVSGIINIAGGDASFQGCMFGATPDPVTAGQDGNLSPVSNGIVTMTASANFSGCTFGDNMSRFGTVYLDSSSMAAADYVNFTECNFAGNETVDGQWGGTAYCTDSTSGRNPMVAFDRCIFANGNNNGTTGGALAFEHDVVSNYFPRYRMGRDCSVDTITTGGAIPGAGVASAEDGGNVDSTPADINGDGTVDGTDLAILLGAWN